MDYGVRHPDGQISVMITGHAFYSREIAEKAARMYDEGDGFGGCDFCGEDAGQRRHEVVARQVGPWTTPV